MIFDTPSIFGWVGMIFIIFSYIMISSKKFKKDYVLYHLLNFIGAVGLTVSTFVNQSWPALTLSLIFATISIVFIVKILSTKNPYKELRVE
jgi:hypothetical protein